MTRQTDSGKGDDRPTVVAMLAEQYSGATMFAILLDHHSRLSCDGETFPSRVGNTVACSCGSGEQVGCDYYRHVCSHMLQEDGRSWDQSLFRREPLYSRHGALHRHLVRFSYFPHVNRARDAAVRANPTWRKIEERFLDAHEKYMRRSLEYKGASVYVDGTKSFRRAALMAASGRVDLRVVYLVRDGRGFARSYVRERDLPAKDLPAGARLWVNGLRRIDAFRERYPDVPVLWVRYKDICGDFDDTLRGIFEFAGVEHEPGIASRVATHHVLGNRIRFSFDGRIRESLAWREEIAPDDLARLTEQMRPGLERFGYL